MSGSIKEWIVSEESLDQLHPQVTRDAVKVVRRDRLEQVQRRLNITTSVLEDIEARKEPATLDEALTLLNETRGKATLALLSIRRMI